MIALRLFKIMYREITYFVMKCSKYEALSNLSLADCYSSVVHILMVARNWFVIELRIQSPITNYKLVILVRFESKKPIEDFISWLFIDVVETDFYYM